MKNKLKVLLSCLIVACTLGAFSACGGSSKDDSAPESITSEEVGTSEGGETSEGGASEGGETEEKTFTVSFEGAEVAAQTIKEGEKASKPEDPANYEADGYSHVFENWYIKDTETVYDFETAVTGNVTLVAKFTKTAIEYTVTFVDEKGETVGADTYTVEDKEITEPDEPVKEGYTVTWKEYTLTTGDVTVEANYAINTYTVTFVDEKGETVGTDTYTVEDKEITEPDEPVKEGYTVTWKTYELTTGDVTVEANYVINTYTVTFVNKAGAALDGYDPITFTVETKDSVKFPEAPDPEMEGWVGGWNISETDLTLEDTMVYYAPSMVVYTVAFTHPTTGAILAAPITYTVETMSEIKFPEVPADLAMEGYTVVWNKTEADVTLGGLDVNPVWKANTYTITYDANGGSVESESQEVTYGEEYTLATATPSKIYQEFLGWVDEDGNDVVSGEAWAIPSDVTLTAKYSNVITFDSMTEVPSYLQNGGRATLSIVEGNGGKVLQATSENNNEGNVRIMMTIADLAQFFEDENVQYLAFDLKLPEGATTSVSSIMYQSADQTSWTSYESGDPDKSGSQFDTTPTDAFKSYYLPRSVYEAWVANGKTEARILNVQAGITQGASYWVDNFRPVTAAEYTADLFSFETGSLRTTMDDGPGFCTPNYNQFHFKITGVDSSTAKFTNEIVSDGMRAIQFTKKSGESVIMFNTSESELKLAMREAGYIAFDLYVPEGSDAKISKGGAYGALKQGWNTIYEQVDATNNEIIRFTDTTASTYVIDNFRLLTEEEYNAAVCGFEAGGVLLDSSNYYYGGADKMSFSTYSLRVTDPNSKGLTVRFDSAIKHSGDYSLAIDKKDEAYLWFSNTSEMYSRMKNGFSCWIYTTVELNNVRNGNNANGVKIAANTWTKVTMTADDIHSTAYRFMMFMDAVECTVYIDDIEPLPASDAE